MIPPEQPSAGYVSVADLTIEAVRPGRTGFLLHGRGADRSEYLLEMHLGLPLDQRTRTVLGELLAQSEWRVLRRASAPGGLKRPLRTRRRVK